MNYPINAQIDTDACMEVKISIKAVTCYQISWKLEEGSLLQSPSTFVSYLLLTSLITFTESLLKKHIFSRCTILAYLLVNPCESVPGNALEKKMKHLQFIHLCYNYAMKSVTGAEISHFSCILNNAQRFCCFN